MNKTLMIKIRTLYRTGAIALSFLLANSVCGQTTELAAADWLPDSERIEVGSLSVPENHADPDGRKIQISYLIIRANDADSNAPPVIFFSGGPGGNTIGQGMVNFVMQHPFTQKRDLILFDQRGIGYSSGMPDMGWRSFGIMADDADESKELELTKEMIDEYKSLCMEKGMQPRYYNTHQNARDVGMLFDHLGYDKYVLFGGSYGTRIARVVQDLFPEHIHCSILDSPSTLTTDFLLQRLESYELALSRIFEYCEDNEDCRSQYPNLEEDYFEAIAELKQRPLKVRFRDSLDFHVNAQDGIYLLRRLLYQDDAREKAPVFIQALKAGQGEILETVIGFEYALTGGLNLTMLLSVEKFENFDPHNSPERILEAYQKHPLLPARLGFFDAFYQAGMQWHNGHMPIEDRRFKDSDVPSIIFVNRFDPVTPPKYGHIFMENLSNGQLFVLDEGGHGGGNQDCKTRVIIDFMDDPNQVLDTQCLNVYDEN